MTGLLLALAGLTCQDGASAGAPHAPGAAAGAADEGAQMWAKLGLRLLPAAAARPWKARIEYRDRRAVVALRPEGPADLAGVTLGAEAVLVPAGATAHVRTMTVKPTREVVNSDVNVLRISGIARPWVLTVTGLQPGVTRITVTDLDGKIDKFVVIVEGRAK